MQLLHDTNGFKFRLSTGCYRLSYIDFYVHLFYRKYGHVRSEFLREFLAKARERQDVELMANLINSTLSSLRHLGVTFEAPEPALEALALMCDCEDPLVRSAVVDMLARMKVYYPDAVEDFMADNRLSEDMMQSIKHQSTSETMIMLTENKGYFFLNHVLLESETMRREFIDLLIAASESKSLGAWLKLFFKRAVNFVYGEVVFRL